MIPMPIFIPSDSSSGVDIIYPKWMKGATMRLIDADALIARWDKMSVRGRTEFDQEIMVAPSIDICFCRECKHYNGKYCFNSNVTLPTAPKPDDFCSYGCRDSEKPNKSEIPTGSERSSE